MKTITVSDEQHKQIMETFPDLKNKVVYRAVAESFCNFHAHFIQAIKTVRAVSYALGGDIGLHAAKRIVEDIRNVRDENAKLCK